MVRQGAHNRKKQGAPAKAKSFNMSPRRNPFSKVAPKPDAPPKDLLAFPVEILENIFESLDSFKTATALATTCKLLGSVYQSSKGRICFGILRYDPVLQGNTQSFYDKAMELFEAQLNGGSEDFGQTIDRLLRTGGLDVVNAVLKNAKVVNTTTEYIISVSNVQVDLGWSKKSVQAFQTYGEEVIRGTLYDLWLEIALGRKLKQRFFNGQKRSPAHPHNQAITADFCARMTVADLTHFGFPDASVVLPPEYNMRHLQWLISNDNLFFVRSFVFAAEERHAAEQRAEQRAAERRAAEQRAAEQRAAAATWQLYKSPQPANLWEPAVIEKDIGEALSIEELYKKLSHEWKAERKELVARVAGLEESDAALRKEVSSLKKKVANLESKHGRKR
ncbi:hypothetical protein FN846DRAFT_901639 [Sphaerosporella brunnea]|uniref:F-box domain-containing protein n=1 Tax=Sphaerosporella brunnea TaxID=1250544 RepID=A0A5J5FCX9_9PEZI|nr:hypothetical protein FN846DRAFT_901639 [Sphaerosporella brunnea]